MRTSCWLDSTCCVDFLPELRMFYSLWLRQVKNVSSDNLEGKVGRMYVPRQEVDTMPLRKMKVSVRHILQG